MSTNTSNLDKLTSPEASNGSLKKGSGELYMNEDKKDVSDADLPSKVNAENGSDSDVSKDEDISFKSDSVSAAASRLTGESIQSNSTEIVTKPKVPKTDLTPNERTDLQHKNEDITDRELCIEIKTNENKNKVSGVDEEASLVIDEANEDDTKSESEKDGGGEVRTFGILLEYAIRAPTRPIDAPILNTKDAKNNNSF